MAYGETHCNVFEGLVSAVPRATVKETQPSPMETPPADDLTASSSTSKAEVEEDIQPRPMGTPLADGPLFHLPYLKLR